MNKISTIGTTLIALLSCKTKPQKRVEIKNLTALKIAKKGWY